MKSGAGLIEGTGGIRGRTPHPQIPQKFQERKPRAKTIVAGCLSDPKQLHPEKLSLRVILNGSGRKCRK